MKPVHLAYEALHKITAEDAYANLALNDVLKKTSDAKTKNLVSAMVYTTLEHMSHADYIISAYAKGKVNSKIRCILRLSVVRLIFMNCTVSRACNEAVELTKSIGKQALSGYVNGIMRNICRAYESDNLPTLPTDRIRRLSVLHGYPEWLIAQYTERFGEDGAESMISVSNDSVSIRPQYPYTAEELENSLSERGISYRRGKVAKNVFHITSSYESTSDALFKEGKITIQSESSYIAVMACNVKSGETVLDACSAPGGKSALIYDLTHGDIDLTSCELHEHRCELIKATFNRLGVEGANVKCMDSSEYFEEMTEKFDCVLVDAPCSGLGITGKPDIRYKVTQSGVKELSELQLKILSNCSRYVKKGGRLIYSTCTVTLDETEGVVNKFLSENSDYALDSVLCDIINISDKSRFKDGMITILPHKDETDAFFIARFIRKG